jgi:hypothetical protein
MTPKRMDARSILIGVTIVGHLGRLLEPST